VGVIGQSEHRQVEGLAFEGPALHQDVTVVSAEAEDFGHVIDDPRVGRCCRGENGRAHRKFGEKGPEPPVVGSEVVTPVGDAVGFVDDEQPTGRCEVGQYLVPELGIVEPLGGHAEDVDLPTRDVAVYLVPTFDIGRVHRDRVDASAVGRSDLVPHRVTFEPPSPSLVRGFFSQGDVEGDVRPDHG